MEPSTSGTGRDARDTADAAAATKKLADRKAGRTAPPKAARTRAPKPPARVRIIWGVGQPGAAPLATFPYKERVAADADAVRRGKGCVVRPLRVPME